MSVRADAENLRLIPIFRDCDPVALQVMAFAAERQNFLQNEALFKEEQPARSAYFIMNGQVSLRQRGAEVGVAVPGSMLGETAMIGSSTYSLTAVATESVATARIDQALFRRVVAEYPEFGRAVAFAISRKLETTVRELDQVRVMMTRGRRLSDF
ncbi:MAG: cyclic nucleotide-binding domain-containing protein [Proteobacteria bacterium]|nr:cyclic nucleotide-binding domain-containing protein [Pseudomonadota bacterium]